MNAFAKAFDDTSLVSGAKSNHEAGATTPYERTFSVALRCGRQISCFETGDPNGSPFVYFHGMGSSCVESRLFAETASELGIRVIALDRPGRGASTVQPGRRIVDWPNDVREVADTLKLEKFALAGLSGGGPYALACTRAMPERITACGLISGAGPAHLLDHTSPKHFHLLFSSGRAVPWLYRPVFGTMGRVRQRSLKSVENQLKLAAWVLCPKDSAIMRDSRYRRFLAQAVFEGAKGDKWSTYEEGAILISDWGFRPEEVRHPRIFQWHGERDRIVPVGLARRLGQALPNCESRFYPQEGHFSTGINNAREILAALCS